jgi:hypothetical protein
MRHGERLACSSYAHMKERWRRPLFLLSQFSDVAST